MNVSSALGIAFCVALLSASPAYFAPHAGPSSMAGVAAGLAPDPIKHVVFLVQENRAYDNLFGLYCQVKGTYCPVAADGIPAGTCVPIDPRNTSAGCVRPYNLTSTLTTDMRHNYEASRAAWDHGHMDGFWAAEGKRNETFGHYNGSTIPVYWDLAEQYALSDRFFSSAQGYSLPNHWYLVADTPPTTGFREPSGYLSSYTLAHRYLNESNATPTIEGELVNSTVSWKYFDGALAPYNTAISTLSQNSTIAGLSAYSYWAPLAARSQSYATNVSNHFVPQSNFFSDASAGSLPSLSWVIPTDKYSDHAQFSNLVDGQDWVTSVVNAVESSPEWNSTVLFVTWDDYGGWYDHVNPPTVGSFGDGMRVPLLAIGPYVRPGYVSHHPMDFGSILRFMERRTGLSCLGAARDFNATMPLDMFNFSQSPRPPIIFTNDTAGATYPMVLQSSLSDPWRLDSPYVPPPTGLNDTSPADAGGD